MYNQRSNCFAFPALYVIIYSIFQVMLSQIAHFTELCKNFGKHEACGNCGDFCYIINSFPQRFGRGPLTSDGILNIDEICEWLVSFDFTNSPDPSLENLRWSVIQTVSFSLSRNQINMFHQYLIALSFFVKTAITQTSELLAENEASAGTVGRLFPVCVSTIVISLDIKWRGVSICHICNDWWCVYKWCLWFGRIVHTFVVIWDEETHYWVESCQPSQGQLFLTPRMRSLSNPITGEEYWSPARDRHSHIARVTWQMKDLKN